MANWGQPDFIDKVSEEEKLALHRRIRLMHGDHVDTEWMHNDCIERGYNPAKVQAFCVRNADWQKVRLSLKGLPTHEKLGILHAYWKKWYVGHYCVAEIQVGNYLGALRRGGQLDSQNRIRRYI